MPRDEELPPESDDTSKLDVFPNPATDVLTVVINDPAAEHLDIRLYDVLGRTVAVLDGAGPSTERLLELDLQNVPAGTYILTVQGPSMQSSRLVTVLPSK